MHVSTSGVRTRTHRFASALSCYALTIWCWFGWPHEANAAISEAVLYTLGPGSDFSQRYGHSVICTREVNGVASGTCVDFGVAEAQSPLQLATSMLRGQARFVPTRVSEEVVLGAFKEQGRKIERQVLPLQAAELEAFASELARATATAEPYAYHPYWSNCSTQLRDRFDRVLGGRLREVSTAIEGRSLRELTEQGNTGRLAELTLFAVALGTKTERKPSAWEAMFLPIHLRDGLTRLGATPVSVAEQLDVVLPTSTHVGRGLLILLGLSLAVYLGLARKRAQVGAALWTSAITLGLLGTLCWSGAAISPWPEIRHNWALLLLLPSDLCLPWLPLATRKRYVKARTFTAVLLATLSLLGVIAQPLAAAALLSGLPLGVLWWRARSVTREQHSSAASKVREAS